MAIVLIAALDRNRAIGRAGGLPWHLPDDLKRFKALTLSGTVLMGRTTAESIGRALPGRRNLVLTRRGHAPYPGQEAVDSLPAARTLAGAADLLVIGGGEVYGLTLPHADRLHLTLVDAEVEGADAWFPAWPPERWREVARVAHAADVLHAHSFSFVDYCRTE